MQYEVCKTCIMNSTASEFKSIGSKCNFCVQASSALMDIQKEKHNLYKFIDQIKKDGKGKKYDCAVGLSGGVDSSYMLHKAVTEFGLRPYCFTVDTGFNKPEADENILNLVETLKVPLYRHVIDLEKFRDLQSAFLQAGLKNAEIPTDAVLMAVTYEIADRYNIKWILSGGNVSEESCMPPSWGYNARDLVHIKDVYKKMKGKKLSGLPVCGLLKWNYYKWVRGIKMFYLLDYI